MFIEVGNELWHWFCHMIGVERNTHFKDKLLSHWYTSNETQLQRWTFNLKSGGTQKSEKKQGTRQHLRAPFKAMDMGCLSNFGQPKSHGRHPPFGFVQKCGNYSTPLRCWSVDWSVFSIWFALWTYLPAVHGLLHATGWLISMNYSPH